MLPILLTGLLAGSQHVVTGADHVAAVAPLAVDSRRFAWTAGLHWGIGHACGLALLGGLFVAFREALPVESISAWSELIVGGLLIVIGGRGLVAAFAPPAHGHRHPRTAFCVGTVHGFAGTSHVIGVVAALALPTRTEAFGYLLGFAAGNVLAMIAFSAMLGFFATRLERNGARAHRRLLCGLSLLTMAVGGVWIGLALR